jgi:hypothetical protein
MAIKTRSELKTAKNAVIIANGTGAITGPVLNTLLEDMLDSLLTLSDWSINAYTVSTSGGTISFDLLSLREALFTGSAAIGAIKTWAFVNDLNSRRMFFRFNINGIYSQTMPANVKMQSFVGEWDDSAKTWTPAVTGDYEAEMSYNGTTWYMKMYGPF